MAADAKQRLRMATVVYWVLLLYIMAALAWWAYSLLQQNAEIHELRKEAASSSSAAKEEVLKIEGSQRRGVYKYIGEGAAFLLLICIGAVFIYRSVRRQFRLQQQEQNFVMAITHELKTPIAVARLNLETIQKRQLEEEKKVKLLQTTLQETLRLDTLINNILLASQLEGQAYQAIREELDFSELVKDGLKSFEARYAERPVAASIQEDVVFNGDAVLLKLLLSNLLENANKYSPKAKTIGLRLQKRGGDILLEVADEGEGIADGEKKNIFKKFYRIGNEQTRRAKGTGLGLYICKKIVQEHGGEILAKDNRPTGSKFVVQFHT